MVVKYSANLDRFLATSKEWNTCKEQPDNRQDSRLACQLTFELSLYVFHLHIESINNLSTGVAR